MSDAFNIASLLSYVSSSRNLSTVLYLSRDLSIYRQGVYIGQYMVHRHSQYISSLVCSDIFPFRYFYRKMSTLVRL